MLTGASVLFAARNLLGEATDVSLVAEGRIAAFMPFMIGRAVDLPETPSKRDTLLYGAARRAFLAFHRREKSDSDKLRLAHCFIVAEIIARDSLDYELADLIEVGADVRSLHLPAMIGAVCQTIHRNRNLLQTERGDRAIMAQVATLNFARHWLPAIKRGAV